MIICVCANISSKQVAVELASGTTTLADLQEKTCAGQRCGRCLEHLKNEFLTFQAKTDKVPPQAER